MRWKSHILLGLAIAFFVVAPAIFGSFTITLMNYIGIYAFAALGLVLLTGVGGLTSFGQAAFVGIGAYATAWYTSVHGGSPGLACCSRWFSLGSSPRFSAPQPCGLAVTSCR